MVLGRPHVKYLTFLLCIVFSASAFSQTTLLSQDFESGTLVNYSVSSSSYVKTVTSSISGNATDVLEFSNNNGSNNRDSDVEFDLVDVSSYTDVMVTISFASLNVDNNENLELYIAYDGGVYNQVAKLIDGQNGGGGEDWDWDENDNDGGAVSSNPYTFIVPNNGYTNIRVQVQAENLDDNEFLYIDDLLIEGTLIASEPIIDLVGNGTTIVSGETAISTGDDTDFGQIDTSSGNDTHTFTIENNGTLDLSSISVSISGDADFTLESSPSSTVSASGSTTFTVKFDPTVDGSRSATVSITSNDSDRSPYTFTVGGEGASPSYCDSYGNSGTSIGITNVSFGTINNSSTGSNDYTDNTGISTDVILSNFYDISVGVDTGGWFSSTETTVWIDWNQNLDFSDDGAGYSCYNGL